METPHRLLVVGATGSIGKYVVASALGHRFTVRVLVRDESQGQLRGPDL